VTPPRDSDEGLPADDRATTREDPVRRQTLLLRFELQATPPAGEPPAFDIKSGPGAVTLLEGEDGGLPDEVSYETHVTLTGETSFLEEGEMQFGYGTLRLSTVGAGLLEPTPEDGLSRGAVVFRVVGAGGSSGVTGLLTSNFEFQAASGTAVEQQVLRLFLP
jgi:hypothetical protein